MSTTRSITGRLAALAIGIVLTFAVIEVSMRFIYPHWREFYSGWFIQVAQVPGHGHVAVGVPNYDGYFAQNNGDFRVHLHINGFGLRDDDPIQAANGRLWVIGDSMAFGWGVSRDRIYTEVIAQKSGVPSYNVAAPGADVCGYQALAARMPASLHPRAVILGFIMENDLADYDCAARAKEPPAPEQSPNSFSGVTSFIGFKYWLTGHSAFYNFLAVAVKRVELVQQALIALGAVARPHAYQAATHDEAAKVEPRVIERTAEEILALRRRFASVPFAVLIAPARFEIRSGDPVYAGYRRGLEAALAARHIDVIDPFDAFKRAGFEAVHFAHDGHWNAAGHRLAGEAAAAWVKSLGLEPAARAAGAAH